VKRIVAVGFENETDPALAGLVDRMHWLRVGQLGKLIAAFKEDGVTECVMAWADRTEEFVGCASGYAGDGVVVAVEGKECAHDFRRGSRMS
jgi:DUF1009 family protein